MAVGLGARRSNADLKFMVRPPTGDVNLSGGQSSGRILVPWGSSSDDSGGDNTHLWVWGITIAAIVYLLGVHWTLGGIINTIE